MNTVGSSRTFGFNFKKSHKKRGSAQDIDFSTPAPTSDVNNNSLEQNIVEITIPSENTARKPRSNRAKPLSKTKSEGNYDDITVLELQPINEQYK